MRASRWIVGGLGGLANPFALAQTWALGRAQALALALVLAWGVLPSRTSEAAGDGVRSPAPADGFVLTQWGPWTVEETLPALDQAREAGARQLSVLVMLCQPGQESAEIHYCDAAPGQSFRETSQGQRISRLLPELAARGLTLSWR